MNQHEDEGEVDVVTIIKEKAKRPSRYKVLLHNDDYTTMEFVIFVLQKYFGKSLDQAQGIMMKVHKEGTGICGIYTHEIAETKVSQVMQTSKQEGHPLICSMEEL
ncbi:MAG: ATP-dependent Clp protease adapter ClpS [Bacteriovoracaceae bacterium]|jgi:ATP-dependent Clp protease adaptor protein ClpS|nr:ATP-dependent Clp protease adapter ClpS [Bacteriovoracaceae bacterium]